MASFQCAVSSKSSDTTVTVARSWRLPCFGNTSSALHSSNGALNTESPQQPCISTIPAATLTSSSAAAAADDGDDCDRDVHASSRLGGTPPLPAAGTQMLDQSGNPCDVSIDISSKHFVISGSQNSSSRSQHGSSRTVGVSCWQRPGLLLFGGSDSGRATSGSKMASLISRTDEDAGSGA